MKYPLFFALILPVLFLVSCNRNPTEPEARVSREAYTITVSALHRDSIEFSYTVNGGTRFILPYHYFDNPLDTPNGVLIRNLSVIDANGSPVDTLCEIRPVGPIDNRIVILPGTPAYPVTFRYLLDWSVLQYDTGYISMPRIHVDESSLFLIGAYCFIIPEFSTSLLNLWRDNHPVDVTVAAPPDLTIYGIPSGTFSCPNLYNLLFLQLSSGPQPVACGHGGGVDFCFVDLFGFTFAASLVDSMTGMFTAILDDIAQSYGSFSGAPYTVSIHNIKGGLEGTYGFAIRNPLYGQRIRLSEILAHEALHHFIGIRCGEYEDLWWKEAAATYLGLETAVRLGYFPADQFYARMTSKFVYADTARFQRSLADPQLRWELFPQALHSLVYERGAQIMMLLDAAVRTGSDNRYTLHHVMADLCRRFSGGGFFRSDFIAALERYGADSASTLFAAYVDRPDSLPPLNLLDRTFNRLDSLAGFFQ